MRLNFLTLPVVCSSCFESSLNGLRTRDGKSRTGLSVGCPGSSITRLLCLRKQQTVLNGHNIYISLHLTSITFFPLCMHQNTAQRHTFRSASVNFVCRSLDLCTNSILCDPHRIQTPLHIRKTRILSLHCNSQFLSLH